MIYEVVRIALRKFIVKIIKLRDEETTSEILRSIAKDNEDMEIEELGLLLSRLPTVKRVELTDWSQNGLIVERTK